MVKDAPAPLFPAMACEDASPVSERLRDNFSRAITHVPPASGNNRARHTGAPDRTAQHSTGTRDMSKWVQIVALRCIIDVHQFEYMKIAIFTLYTCVWGDPLPDCGGIMKRPTGMKFMRCLRISSTLLTCFLMMTSAAWADSVVFKRSTTADHTKFKELQQPFASGPDVTAACLKCHTEAAKQVHQTKHWKWEFINPVTSQKLGKRNVLNNFCISIQSNYSFCTGCHIGYGWKDGKFDFSSENNVDCLVCHDTTGGYKKYPGFAGHPLYKDTEIPPGSGKIVKAPDLSRIAQRVGKTSRDNCGACHFYGGGGDGVKHGDLDSSLFAPDKALDVHMDAAGLDFTCSTCHRGTGHDVAGSRYTLTAIDKGGALMRGRNAHRNPATCVSCHSNTPHKHHDRLNLHARKIACQTCHIPEIARGGVPTKVFWDWSKAGKLDHGKRIQIKDAKGHLVYDSHKGEFKLAEDIPPEYTWFNGDVRYTLVGDKISKADEPITINKLGGGPTDGRSLIWPVKWFRSVQPYDTVNNTLVTPHLAGDDDTAYWKNYVWDKAIAVGMQDKGAPFSGKFGFIKTRMAWPITHMVAPKEKALHCPECHAREGGRLANIAGVYMPGRDRAAWLDNIMWALVGLTILAVIWHAGMRIVSSRRRNGGAS
jgi:octaheme c-type cytochrome (tetrathionate reductase family)